MNAVDFCKAKLGTLTPEEEKYAADNDKILTRIERMERLTKNLAPQRLGWAIYKTSKVNETVCITNHGEYFNRIIIDGVDVWLAYGVIMHTFEKAGPHLVCLGLDPDTTTLGACFHRCRNLNMLDLSNWKTDSVASTGDMFNSCLNLSHVCIKGWEAEKLEETIGMFNECKNLTFLDLSGWNVKKVKNACCMVSDCEKLTSLDLSGWNPSTVEEIRRQCPDATIKQ